MCYHSKSSDSMLAVIVAVVVAEVIVVVRSNIYPIGKVIGLKNLKNISIFVIVLHGWRTRYYRNLVVSTIDQVLYFYYLVLTDPLSSLYIFPSTKACAKIFI
jgi:uncharacterized paraquat-inducible protein A